MISNIWNMFLLRYHKVKIGNNLKIYGFINLFGNDISIGNNVIIRSGRRHNPSDGGCYTCIFTMNEGTVKIGNNVGISNSQICAYDTVIIGDDVLIGGGTRIYDTDFHPLEYGLRKKNDITSIKHEPVVIEKGVFVGTGSIILKGSHIGENSIIGAGSVVAGKVPSNEIWAGNPARFVKNIKCGE